MKTEGDWIFKFVPIFIAAVFILVICGFIGYGYLGYRAMVALKDCTPAITSKDVGAEHQYSVGCKK